MVLNFILGYRVFGGISLCAFNSGYARLRVILMVSNYVVNIGYVIRREPVIGD